MKLDHPEVARLARELAALTGESMSDAVVEALRERLSRERDRQQRLAEDISTIGKRCAALPICDDREPDAILFDDFGLPR